MFLRSTISQFLRWSPSSVCSSHLTTSAQQTSQLSDRDTVLERGEVSIGIYDWPSFRDKVDAQITDLVEDLHRVRYEHPVHVPSTISSITNDLAEMYVTPACKVINAVFPIAYEPAVQVLTWEETLKSGKTVHLIQVLMEDDVEDSDWERSWARPSRPASNWRLEKKSFLILVFVDRGSLILSDFQDGQHVVRSHADSIEAFQLLQECLIDTKSPFGLLSDEHSSMAWMSSYADCRKAAMLARMTHIQCPIRAVIAALVRMELISIGLWPPHRLPWSRPYQGALPDTIDTDVVNEAGTLRWWFSDFDFFALQRSIEALRAFRSWRKITRREAMLVQKGDKLSIVPNTAAFRRLKIHRSPYPAIPLPPDSEAIVTRHPRGKSIQVENMLESSRKISMEVIEVKRAEVNTYSQVFIVRLEGCDELLCLKLYDERFFDISNDLDTNIWAGHNAEDRLKHVICSEDLIGREVGVYERLKDLQGRLLPHSYGTHLIALPDGWRCYGFLMEALPGPTLAEIPDLYKLPVPVQKDMILRIRHGFRALRYALIDQQDWHGSQFICLPCQTEAGQSWEVVFIDFAFAFMPLGEGGLPMIRSDNSLRMKLLGYFSVPLVAKLWFPMDEEEVS